MKENRDGLSVIVCSVREDRLEELKRNISATIGEGVEYEILFRRNSADPLPLAKVYNSLAEKARYGNLLFIHEDAGFESRGWYDEIKAKIGEPATGLIGFAGGKIMSKAPGGWNQSEPYNVRNLRECGDEIATNLEEGSDFTEVVSVDGFAMFVRKEVWEENRFDEEMLDGFHCYDTDFGLSVGRERMNYVSNRIVVYHNSRGNLDGKWVRSVMKMYRGKWEGLLPRRVEGAASGDKILESERERGYYRFLKIMRREGIEDKEMDREFRRMPLSLRHIGHLLKLATKYRRR